MQATPSSEQVVLLPNIQYEDMSSLVQYMYTGQVFIHQDMLGRLLKTAQALQVKGLIEQSADRVEGIQVILKHFLWEQRWGPLTKVPSRI